MATPISSKSYTLKDFLLMPFGCLLSISPYMILIGLGVAAAVGYYLYENVNIDLLGIGIPQYDQLKWSPKLDTADQSGQTWTIQFESLTPSRYTGVVRHISPIRLEQISLLTHDILVTSGDFADPNKVTTEVINHHFTWLSKGTEQPQGEIHLIHAVPQTEALYRMLLKIEMGKQVTITGLEIARINALKSNGQVAMYWQDSGCNTLLITSVEIK